MKNPNSNTNVIIVVRYGKNFKARFIKSGNVPLANIILTYEPDQTDSRRIDSTAVRNLLIENKYFEDNRKKIFYDCYNLEDIKIIFRTIKSDYGGILHFYDHNIIIEDEFLAKANRKRKRIIEESQFDSESDIDRMDVDSEYETNINKRKKIETIYVDSEDDIIINS